MTTVERMAHSLLVRLSPASRDHIRWRRLAEDGAADPHLLGPGRLRPARDMWTFTGKLRAKRSKSNPAKTLLKRRSALHDGNKRRPMSCAPRDEPGPAVGRTRSAGRGARSARAGLRLVHRGVRHDRSETGEGAARRTGVNQRLARAESGTNVRGRPDYPRAWARNGSFGSI